MKRSREVDPESGLPCLKFHLIASSSNDEERRPEYPPHHILPSTVRESSSNDEESTPQYSPHHLLPSTVLDTLNSLCSEKIFLSDSSSRIETTSEAVSSSSSSLSSCTTQSAAVMSETSVVSSTCSESSGIADPPINLLTTYIKLISLHEVLTFLKNAYFEVRKNMAGDGEVKSLVTRDDIRLKKVGTCRALSKQWDKVIAQADKLFTQVRYINLMDDYIGLPLDSTKSSESKNVSKSSEGKVQSSTSSMTSHLRSSESKVQSSTSSMTSYLRLSQLFSYQGVGNVVEPFGAKINWSQMNWFDPNSSRDIAFRTLLKFIYNPSVWSIFQSRFNPVVGDTRAILVVWNGLDNLSHFRSILLKQPNSFIVENSPIIF